MSSDEIYILRCLELAAKGLGKTRQNPMVGSVIVHDGKIIGEGYHIQYGQPHAEVNAINSVTDKSLLRESTLYVNLEPCSHYGKTPPCTLLIKDYKIPRVVIGTIDTNPVVAGKGVKILVESGIKVITGIKEKECRFLNRRFFTFHEKKRPYIILKWAQSRDGFIDVIRDPWDTGYPNWISNQSARVLVHKWRAEEMALMVGTNTVEIDNPSLTLRHWPGENPLRVIPDKSLRLSESSAVFTGADKTLVFTCENKLPEKSNPEYIFLPQEKFSLATIMEELYKRKILSIMVEGGSVIVNNFIDSGLWDEARVFIGNDDFNSGVKAPHIHSDIRDYLYFHGFRLDLFRNES